MDTYALLQVLSTLHESVATYIALLKHIAENCNFGDGQACQLDVAESSGMEYHRGKNQCSGWIGKL